jgi:peptidoglycan/xylan/chitin deacetylase (PgdA/CDA1 family)
MTGAVGVGEEVSASVHSDDLGPLVRVRKRLAQTQYGRRVLGSLAGVALEDPLFAVTFDDGPHPDVTPRVLDLLSARNFTATFFMPAQRALEHPDLVREVAARGNEIGVHGFSHTRITELGPRAIRHETATARRELRRIVGTRSHWFRPPYGAQNIRTFLATRLQGMDVAVWDVDPSDALTTTGFEVTADGPGRLRIHAAGAEMSLVPGRILLLHDTPAADDQRDGATRKIMLIERLLDGIGSVGGRTSTLSDILGRGVADRRIWRSPGY